jgi:hypothetical protein
MGILKQSEIYDHYFRKKGEMQPKDLNTCIKLLNQNIEEYEESLQLLYDITENIFKMNLD